MKIFRQIFRYFRYLYYSLIYKPGKRYPEIYANLQLTIMFMFYISNILLTCNQQMNAFRFRIIPFPLAFCRPFYRIRRDVGFQKGYSGYDLAPIFFISRNNLDSVLMFFTQLNLMNNFFNYAFKVTYGSVFCVIFSTLYQAIVGTLYFFFYDIHKTPGAISSPDIRTLLWCLWLVTYVQLFIFGYTLLSLYKNRVPKLPGILKYITRSLKIWTGIGRRKGY